MPRQKCRKKYLKQFYLGTFLLLDFFFHRLRKFLLHFGTFSKKRGISFLLAIQNKNHWCYKLLICEQTGKNGMVLQKQILKVVEAAKFEKSAFLPKFDNFCRLALFTMMLITPSIKETIFLHIFFFRRLSLICMPDLNIV